MTKLLTRSLIAAAVLLPLTGCPGTTPGATTLPSHITGSVVKGTAPFPNATVRLIQKANNTTSDYKVITTDNTGTFKFENVPPGDYRVAFDRATPDQRQKNETVYYTAGVDTFGFYSTTEFTFGANATTKQIPQMDVAWAANLTPAPDASVSAPVSFTWAAAPKATSYTVRIANESNNTVFTSPSLAATATSFTWNGNNASGAKAPAGKYYWSVNVNGADFMAGTNLSPFTLQ